VGQKVCDIALFTYDKGTKRLLVKQ